MFAEARKQRGKLIMKCVSNFNKLGIIKICIHPKCSIYLIFVYALDYVNLIQNDDSIHVNLLFIHCSNPGVKIVF